MREKLASGFFENVPVNQSYRWKGQPFCSGTLPWFCEPSVTLLWYHRIFRVFVLSNAIQSEKLPCFRGRLSCSFRTHQVRCVLDYSWHLSMAQPMEKQLWYDIAESANMPRHGNVRQRNVKCARSILLFRYMPFGTLKIGPFSPINKQAEYSTACEKPHLRKSPAVVPSTC